MKTFTYRCLFLLVLCHGIYACKKEVRQIEKELPVTITINEITRKPDEIKVKFEHDGTEDALIGIVHAADSAALVSKINAGSDKQMLTAESTGAYAYTFGAEGNAEKIFYSFVVSVNGSFYYSPIHASAFGPFEFFEFGFVENVLGGAASTSSDADVLYRFTNNFRDFSGIKFFIDDVELAPVYSENDPESYGGKLPDDVRAGDHTYRMTYYGREVISRSIYIPQGRIRLASKHPEGQRQVVGYFIHNENLCLFSTQYSDNTMELEYAAWNPVTNQWRRQSQYGSAFDQTMPSNSLQNNFGVAVRGIFYFTPVIELWPQGYVQVMRSFDPVRMKWTVLDLMDLYMPNGDYNLHMQNMISHNDRLYILQYGYDGNWPSPAYHIYRYDPSDRSYTSFSRLPLPKETTSARLLTDGSDYYVVAFIDYKHPYYRWDYEVQVYRTDAEFRTLTHLGTVPSNGIDGEAILINRSIYVYGGHRSGVLRYEAIHFGAQFDLITNNWQYLNPTYGNNGIQPSGYFDALFSISGRVFSYLGPDGEIVEWDVDYRK